MKGMPKRREVLFLSALSPMLGMAATGASPKLPNATMDAGRAKLERLPFGDQRTYFDGPTDQLQSMTAGSLLLKPGMSPHAPHQHPEEEIMVVTEGSGEIVVEGKTTKVGPGSMMYCAGNKLHGVKNTGMASLLFYFYKWKA
jgi:quercetin dioxygenase-like cupin family protein